MSLQGQSLSHFLPTPSVTHNHKVIRAQRPYSITTMYLGISDEKEEKGVISRNITKPLRYKYKGEMKYYKLRQ